MLKFPVGDLSESEVALKAMDAAADRFGFAFRDLSSLRIGSTGALNAVLQRKGTRVALLATQGFTDTFFMARQNRADLYDPAATSRTPAFLLDAGDVHAVSGRIDADGTEIALPDLDAVARLSAELAHSGVGSIAVCLLFAHLNPAHELACLEVLERHCPEIPVSLSHRVDPQPREYERTVSTVLDAWLKPRFTRATHDIAEGLAARGFAGDLLFGDGRGALVSAQAAMALPAITLASGPAAAARHAAMIPADSAAQARLVMDIGSVSCDLSHAPAGAPPPLVTASVYGGIPLRREMVDLHSFALGGRQAAMLTPEGQLTFVLRDGPDHPTLELALRACGRIAPDLGADDLAPLAELAQQADWRDANHAARRIIAAAEHAVAAAMVNYAVRRNLDPARAQLVAIGGLGPLLAPGVAALLGIREVLLPDAPAAAGALGLLNATQRLEAGTAVALALRDLTPQHLTGLFQTLAADIARQTQAEHHADLAPPCAVITMAATAQMHPVQIEITPPPQTAHDIAAAFRTAYQIRYGIAPPGEGYVFSILLRRDGAAVPDTTPISDSTPIDTSERVETDAGTLYVPAPWHLARTGGGYALRQTEDTA